jgi:hypothetical protein
MQRVVGVGEVGNFPWNQAVVEAVEAVVGVGRMKRSSGEAVALGEVAD